VIARRLLQLAPLLILILGAVQARCGEIHELIEKGDLDKVKALLTKTPDLKQARDKMELTPLHTAVQANKLEIVKYLLGLDVEVNAEAYNRFTPLHFAENPKIIKLLLPTARTSKPSPRVARLSKNGGK
jgi:ankyrin repeat protein